MEIVPPLVDHTCYFRHAPARLRVDVNMCGFASGYAAVCVLRAVVRSRCYTGWVWGNVGS